MKLLGQVRPLACLFASGFLFCGCSAVDPHAPIPPLPPLPSSIRHPLSSAAPAPPAPPKTWRWECWGTPLDGSMKTGIESSTNLGLWHLEAEWPVTAVSNSWTDPDPSPPVKFYRAFIK